MKTLVLSLALACLTVFPCSAATPADKSDNRFVYADFEDVKDGRPVSKNGGRIQLTTYAQNQANAARATGVSGVNPPAPELVHLKAGDPNRAAMFGFELTVPNDYAGVTLEIRGHELEDGKTVPDDLSGYSTLSVDAFADGVNGLRVEIFSVGTGVTKGNDSDTVSGFPQKTFKVNPGLNTYKIKLDTLKQPGWQQAFRVGVKEVLQKLTAVHFTVFCEGGCKSTTGRIIIDNVVFEK